MCVCVLTLMNCVVLQSGGRWPTISRADRLLRVGWWSIPLVKLLIDFSCSLRASFEPAEHGNRPLGEGEEQGHERSFGR